LHKLTHSFLPGFCGKPQTSRRRGQPISVAVVGGIGLCGVWDKLARKIETATGVEIDLPSLSYKEGILPEFRSVKAGLLLVHGGKETFRFQAEGISGQQRLWTYKEHVIVGPDNEPPGVASAPAHAARLFASGQEWRHLVWALGLTEHSQDSTMVIAIANLTMATDKNVNGRFGKPGNTGKSSP
jgi:hypothetical protein